MVKKNCQTLETVHTVFCDKESYISKNQRFDNEINIKDKLFCESVRGKEEIHTDDRGPH